MAKKTVKEGEAGAGEKQQIARPAPPLARAQVGTTCSRNDCSCKRLALIRVARAPFACGAAAVASGSSSRSGWVRITWRWCMRRGALSARLLREPPRLSWGGDVR